MASDPSGRRRIIVIDDDEGVRAVLRVALETSGQFLAVAEAPDGTTASELIAEECPDTVVVDLGLPDVTGFDLIPQVHALAPDALIVVFSASDVVSEADIAPLPAGTRFVVKGDLDRLIAALAPSSSIEAQEVASMVFPRHPASASRARRFISEACDRCGCLALADDVRLIVRELATNAFVHAGSHFEVRLRRSQRLLRIEVRDESSRVVPDPQTPGGLAEHGRGFMLVSALSNAWGIEPTLSGKVIWAELCVAAT